MATHSLVLKSDGTVVGWGDNSCRTAQYPRRAEQCDRLSLPEYNHNLALYTVPPDSTPPTTSASTNPASANANGWYNQDVTVNLSTIDMIVAVVGSSPSRYSMNGGTATTVNAASASVTISGAGTTTLSYSATDNAGE